MSSSLLYIPCASLNPDDIESLVKLCLTEDVHRVDVHGGRKAALKYLSNMNTIGFDLSPYINSKQIQKLEKEIKKLKKVDLFKKEFDQNEDEKFEPYWEINNPSTKIHQLAKNARQFTNTQNGFSPERLKIYFNSLQIDNIPYSKATFENAGFVDDDARQFMIKYPIHERKNQGQINTKKGRIEDAIFDVPPGNQIIVLDFADERMPGGLFLYGASTQEETICYHSDAYRALLDLKYNRFDGGYFIPEFGCLYVKQVQFHKPSDPKQVNPIDIVVAACYDLTGEHGLYKPPDSKQQIEINTKKKLETIIAAAQANTEGNGQNTYLILGPIGCGAFQNKLDVIVRLWAEILLKPLNRDLDTQQRHAFEHIWFLSGKEDKLETFEKAFQLNQEQRL